MVILDPPAFTKGREALAGALRGYNEINLRAMKLLDRGGILVTCSCSYHVDAATFLDMLRSAAADAHREFRLLELRTQAADHPILLAAKETQYLKCAILEAATDDRDSSADYAARRAREIAQISSESGDGIVPRLGLPLDDDASFPLWRVRKELRGHLGRPDGPTVPRLRQVPADGPPRLSGAGGPPRLPPLRRACPGPKPS